MSDRATLVQIYIAFYDRAPDPEGLAFWQSVCDGGLALSEIAELFAPQPESIATYPFLDNFTDERPFVTDEIVEGIRSFIADVYENLFNRAPDAAGEAFWTNEIVTSLSSIVIIDDDGNVAGEIGLSIGEVILKIIEGAQGDDITALNNKTTVALDWHDKAALTDGYVQTDAAATASRLALSVVDATDFSVVQGRVLNENYFEDLVEAESGLTPFVAGAFDPIVQPGTVPQFEIPANGFINNDQNTPEIVVLADGKVVISYLTGHTGGREIAFRILNADGSVAGPDAVVWDTGSAGFNYDMTALPDGGFVIFADDDRPDLPDGVHAYRFDGIGQLVGAPVTVNVSDEPSVYLDVSVSYQPTGTLLYTYSVLMQNADGVQIIGRSLTLDGEEATPEAPVNMRAEDDQTQPASASLADGTTLVVFTTVNDPDGADADVMGRLYAPDGTALDEPFILTESVQGDQVKPAVASLGDDRFVVVFQTNAQEPNFTGFDVSATILDRNGAVETEEFGVNTNTNRFQQDAKVAELADGNFVVVWQTDETFQTDIRAKIFEPDGTPASGEIAVNTLTADSQRIADVAATQDGFIVTWQSSATTLEDFSPGSIRLATFDLDGAPVALPEVSNENLSSVFVSEFQVNDQIQGTQSDPQVVGLSDGRSVISYLDEPSGKTFFEVRAADGSPLSANLNVSLDDVEMIATPDGGFAVVGVDPRSGGNITLQIFDSALNTDGPTRVSLTSGTHVDPVVGVNSDTGALYVSWTTTSGADPLAKARAFDADGTAQTGETSFARGFEVQGITTSSDGTVLAVGQTENSIAGFGDNISLALLLPDLGGVSVKLLPVDTSGVQTDVTAAPLADGNYLVVFNSDVTPGDGSLSGLSGIVIDGNGDAVGAEFSVSQSTLGTQTAPDATVLSDGRVLVSWTGDTAGGAGQDIYGRVFNADGSMATDEFVITPTQEDNQSMASISAAGNGFVAAWQIDNGVFGDESDSSINAAIFDENLSPINVPLVVGNQGFSFISVDDILDLQDIPLLGSDFEITGFGGTAFAAGLSLISPELVRYNPFTLAPEIGNIPEGEQRTEIFTYTVEDDLGNQVELIGSFIVQGYESVII